MHSDHFCICLCVKCGAKSSDSLCERVVAALEGGGVAEELRETLTPETFARTEKALVAAILSKHDDKVSSFTAFGKGSPEEQEWL